MYQKKLEEKASEVSLKKKSALELSIPVFNYAK